MFGLIKYKKSSKFESNEFRKCYCGTCKTIGKIYGHKERLSLNTDVAFLSYLLMSIDCHETCFGNIEVNKCFKLPQDHMIPDILKYSSSINILILYLKIIDNIQDSKFKLNIWLIIKWLESSKFKKAKALLISYGLNVNWIEESIKQQFQREKDAIQIGYFNNTFKYYAQITGEITGKVYEQGVIMINNKSFSTQFFEIGKSFGELVYLIDAIDDYTSDRKMNRFNIFKFNSNSIINESDFCEVIKYIETNIANIQAQIKLLPLSDSKKRFVSRVLDHSFTKYTYCDCTKSRINPNLYAIPVKEKIRLALSEANRITSLRGGKIFKHIAFVYFTIVLLIFIFIFPNSVYSNDAINPNLSTDCCTNCGGFCDTCCFCGDEDCKNCGCCRDIGSAFDNAGSGNSCANCCTCCCVSSCILNCLQCSGDSGSRTFVIFEKDDDGCCN